VVIDALISQTQIHALAAAFLPDCSTDGDSVLCKLPSILHLLYVLGAVLAVILVIVIAFAIRAWQAGRDNEDIPPAKSERRHD
jgi:hypothetical protein